MKTTLLARILDGLGLAVCYFVIRWLIDLGEAAREREADLRAIKRANYLARCIAADQRHLRM